MQVLVAGHGTVGESTNPAGSLWVGVIDAAEALGAGVAMLLAGAVAGLGADVELIGAELGSVRPGAATGGDIHAAHALRTTIAAEIRFPRRVRCIGDPLLKSFDPPTAIDDRRRGRTNTDATGAGAVDTVNQSFRSRAQLGR